MKMHQQFVQLSHCLLLIGQSRAFSRPRSYHPVRCKGTSCYALQSLKPRRNTENDNSILNTVDKESDTNSNSLINGLRPVMQVDLNMKLDDSLSFGSQDQLREVNDSSSSQWILIGGTALVLAAAFALGVSMSNDLGLDLEWRQLVQDPSTSFDMILQSISEFDPQKGMLYYSAFYILAEILAIPAVPILTASSGYLFGLFPGTAVCLFSAAIAASISFVIGRTILRGYVEGILVNNPKFRSMDRAVEKEGFKLMLLLRLSPLFPFALSNYLYGASSIQFWPFFFGTLLGFAPGTFAYVYAGEIGKALTDVEYSANSQPWYVYVGGVVILGGLLKIAGDVASEVVNAIDIDE